MGNFSIDFNAITARETPRLVEQLTHSVVGIQQEVGHFLTEWFSPEPTITVHTSGSTGKAKEIKLQKKHVLNSAKMTGEFFGLQAGQTALLCISPKYIGGKMMIIRALLHRMKLVITEPTATPLSELTQKIDFAALVPLQIYETLNQPNGIECLEKIKDLIVGGGTIPRQLEQRLQTIKSNLYATYGMTETISHIALRKLNGHYHSEWYQALAGINISLNKHGCLQIDAPEIAEHLVSTTDIALINPSNAKEFKILGRADNIINTGGIKVNPEEIEEQLNHLILQPYFIGSKPDEKFENRLILLIEGEIGTQDLLTLQNFIQQHLPPAQRPKEIIQLNAFVRTETGKIQRQETVKKLG